MGAIQRRNKHRVHGLAWDDEKRIEVATADVMGLKTPQIQAATGVAAGTVKKWRQEEWYQDLIREIQNEDDREVDGKLTRLVNKSLDVISDRMENGDWMWNSKENKFVRKPVYMKDANRVATDLINRRNLLRGKPTSISNKEQMSDKLLALAEQFARFTSAKTIQGEVLNDAEATDAGDESHGTHEAETGSASGDAAARGSSRGHDAADGGPSPDAASNGRRDASSDAADGRSGDGARSAGSDA